MSKNHVDISDESSMYRLEGRLKSFSETVLVEGKRCRWPYKVIPSQGMSDLGYFYYPIKDNTEPNLHKDGICCIYCHETTQNFRDCRTNQLNTTFIKILQKHLDITKGKKICLLSHMRLHILNSINQEKPLDWSQDEYFCNPRNQDIINFREWTFKNNWKNIGLMNLTTSKMAEAGLLRYDCFPLFPGKDLNVEEGGEYQDATYCIYCNKIIGSWQLHDDPMWEHYKCCNGGDCYFFQTLQSQDIIHRLQTRFSEWKAENDTELANAADYSEMLSVHLSRMEESLTKNGGARKTSSRQRKSLIFSESEISNISNLGNSTSIENIPSTEKRKPGRPRKTMKINSSSSHIPEANKKSKRGRPKKGSAESQATDSHSDTVVIDSDAVPQLSNPPMVLEETKKEKEKEGERGMQEEPNNMVENSKKINSLSTAARTAGDEAQANEFEVLQKKKRGKPKKYLLSFESKADGYDTDFALSNSTSTLENEDERVSKNGFLKSIEPPKEDGSYKANVNSETTAKGQHEMPKKHGTDDRTTIQRPAVGAIEMSMSEISEKEHTGGFTTGEIQSTKPTEIENFDILVENSQDSYINDHYNVPSTVPEKRRRGRPRKRFTKLGEDTVSIPQLAIRKRGRPRKNDSATDLDPMFKPLAAEPEDLKNQQAIQNGTEEEHYPVDTKAYYSPKKKRRLKKASTQPLLEADDESKQTTENDETGSNKSIVLNFKNNTLGTSKSEKKNAILDDSFDAFSFSNNGNSDFIIPENAFLSPSKSHNDSAGSEAGGLANKVVLPSVSENVHETEKVSNSGDIMQSIKNTSLNSVGPRNLDTIDMDIDISEDSDIDSVCSTPVQSPGKHIKKALEIKSVEHFSKSSEGRYAIQRVVENEKFHNNTFMVDDLNDESSVENSLELPGSPVRKSVSEPQNQKQTGAVPLSNALSLSEEDLQDHGTPETTISKQSSRLSQEGVLLGPLTDHSDIQSRPEGQTRKAEPLTNGQFNQIKTKSDRNTGIVSSTVKNITDADEKSSRPLTSVTNKKLTETWTILSKGTFARMDENKKIVRDYLHELLQYINNNNATLKSDKDGDLNFFIQQMPEVELDMTFHEWIDKKKNLLKKEFSQEVQQKLEILQAQFEKAKRKVEEINDDEVLLEIGKTHGIL